MARSNTLTDTVSLFLQELCIAMQKHLHVHMLLAKTGSLFGSSAAAAAAENSCLDGFPLPGMLKLDFANGKKTL